jgi:hypothetical protein
MRMGSITHQVIARRVAVAKVAKVAKVARFLIKTLYLIGMWFSEDQTANIIKTRV